MRFCFVGGEGGLLSMRVTLFEGLSRDSTLLVPTFHPLAKSPKS